MSTFSVDWLALRESADHASINAKVRQHLRAYFAGHSSIRAVDLGCGTGSNLRSLAPDLPVEQNWTLVDFDPHVLEVAQTRAAEIATGGRRIFVITKSVDLSQHDLSGLLDTADLVSAAAFFDLVSADTIEDMAARIAKTGCAFVTSLTYDGIVAWLPQHTLDAVVRDAFNAHQRSDKGFGPAAGPDATNILATAFERHGYQILRGASPWVLTSQFAELRRQTNAGWARAVSETGSVSDDDLRDWLQFHQAGDAAVTIVGHEDLLALPPK